MNVDSMNRSSIPNLESIQDMPVNVSDVKKIEERMCYDAYWEVYTNYGTVTIKTYDGISYNDMLSRVKNCFSISSILALQPNCFYYD